MLKLKYSFLALAIFMMAGLVLSGNAHADPVCGTLEECRSLRTHLQEQLIEQDSKEVRKILVSHLDLVNTRIEALLSCQPCVETRPTATGHVFTRDRSHATLNEAWRDPSGLIWGDIVKKTDGTVHTMNHNDATNYCTSIGARLPSKEEFTRLREWMEVRLGLSEWYIAQVLPNLSGYRFWSSSVYPDDADYAYVFDGRNGFIELPYRVYSGDAVRCVVGR